MDSDEPAFVDEAVEEPPAGQTSDSHTGESGNDVALPNLESPPNNNNNNTSESLSTVANPLNLNLVPPQTHTHTHKRRLHVSPTTLLNHLLRASVKPGTWIYVSSPSGHLYIGIKSSGAFQHASFLSGARISSAGLIGVENGQLTYLSPLSGHYRPTTQSFRRFVEGLRREGVGLEGCRVSGAYEVLCALEWYGGVREGVRRVVHPHAAGKEVRKTGRRSRRSSSSAVVDGVDEELEGSTDLVDRHWQEEHDKRGLARLMDDLHIRRRSSERREAEQR